jgi:putative hydrolase
MTDNLFDRLADLFRSPGPVNWRLAREIAESAAGPNEPIDPWLDEEYRDLAATAVRYVDAASPLDPLSMPSPGRVLDRRSWATASTEGLAYLAEPLAEKLMGPGPLPEMLRALGPALVGLQIGGMVGAMSHRTLGGFDVGLPAGRDESPAYLVPNIEQFSTDHDLDPRQVRLWVAMHETTHVAAMTVPWVREHAVMRMDAFVASLTIDEEGIAERMQNLQDPEALQRMVEGGDGMPSLLAATGGAHELDDVRALMSVVEGYADLLIDRSVGGLIPQAGAVREAVDRRRAEPSPGERMLGQMIGLDLQHARYRLGSSFCLEVARRWGDEAVHRLWESPEMLPRAGDLEDPVAWAARALL